MSDQKISQFSTITTFTGIELFPLLQSSVNHKAELSAVGTYIVQNYISGASNQVSAYYTSNKLFISIDTHYIGQTSITTLGTIIAGTWNGSVIHPAFGGTGTATSGTANQLLGANSTGTATEWKSFTNTQSLTWSNAANSISATVLLSAFSTSNLTEGTNLYFTTLRTDTEVVSLIKNTASLYWNNTGTSLSATVALSAFSTTNLSEGTNLYYTNSRVDTEVGSLVKNTSSIYWTSASTSLSATVSLSGFSTSNLSEGTNLYYTVARARSTVSGTTNVINYTPSTGVFTIDSAYVGQTSIITLGTITTGTWNATTIHPSHGGTGLTTSGTSNQILGANNGGTLLEYKTLVAGSNVTITHGSGTITIAATSGSGGGGITSTGGSYGLIPIYLDNTSISGSSGGSIKYNYNFGLPYYTIPLASVFSSTLQINGTFILNGLFDGNEDIIGMDATGNVKIADSAGKFSDGSRPVRRTTTLNPNTIPYIAAGGALASMTSATNGQILVGVTSAAPIWTNIIGSFIRVTNNPGGIIIANSQNLDTSASVTFAGLTVGSLNGYFKGISGAVSAVNISTSDVLEGSNLYFTNARVDTEVISLIKNTTSIYWNSTSNSLSATVSLSAFSTSNLLEGTNRYFTESRARFSVSGTVNRISYNTSTGVFDIDSSYIGQSSITTLGTITSGTWNGNKIDIAHGGTNLSTTGSANQILGMNSGGTGYEYKTLVAGSNVTITHGTNSITIAASVSGSGGSSQGTGTPGNITKWTGTSAIGDSTLYESNNSIYYSSTHGVNDTFSFNLYGISTGDSGINGSLYINPTLQLNGSSSNYEGISLQAYIIADIESLKEIAIHDLSFDSGTVATQYGIYIDSLTTATINYAIYTNVGTVNIGDNLYLRGTANHIYTLELSSDIQKGLTSDNDGHAAGIYTHENLYITGDFNSYYSSIEVGTNTVDCTIVNMIEFNGIRISSPTTTEGLITTINGLKIENIAGATDNNYAIYTNQGLNLFGDQVNIGNANDLSSKSSLWINAQHIANGSQVFGAYIQETIFPTDTGLDYSGIQIYSTVDNYFNNIDTLSGLYIRTTYGSNMSPFCSQENGIYIEDVLGGSSANYAIYTNAGVVRLGDVLELNKYTRRSNNNFTQSDFSGDQYVINGDWEYYFFNMTAEASGVWQIILSDALLPGTKLTIKALVSSVYTINIYPENSAYDINFGYHSYNAEDPLPLPYDSGIGGSFKIHCITLIRNEDLNWEVVSTDMPFVVP